MKEGIVLSFIMCYKQSPHVLASFLTRHRSCLSDPVEKKRKIKVIRGEGDLKADKEERRGG